MGTKAIYRQHRQSEPDTLAKIRYAKYIGEFLNHRIYFFLDFCPGLFSSAGAEPPITSALPPDFAIFS